MRIVMINDCSHVGETLLTYLPTDVDAIHLKRTRSFFDKTVKIAWRILRSKGDIYHCHYLLQDCWLALKLGKHPILGHAHGSDIRNTFKHSILGPMVRGALKGCDKIVVSTPNLLETAKEYSESAEYVPSLVNENIFYIRRRKKTVNKIKILIASASDWNVRGTDRIIRALRRIKDKVEVSIITYGVDINRTLKLARVLGLPLTVLPPVAHFNMPKYYWNVDAVVASIGIGGTLGMVALEAIACGRPVITRVSSDFSEYKDFPLLDVSTSEDIVDAVLSLDEDTWKREYAYFKSNHNPERVTRRFLQIYNDTISQHTRKK